jgi:hypothetical protein
MSIFQSNAKNTPAYTRSHDDDKYRGLENIINRAVNAKITLTTNIWIAKGLVNGANGVIRDVIYELNNSNPTALLIQFENYNGPRLFNEDDTRKDWIPIISTVILPKQKLRVNSFQLNWHMRLLK